MLITSSSLILSLRLRVVCLHVSPGVYIYACAHHGFHAFASWAAMLTCADVFLAPELQVVIYTLAWTVALLLCWGLYVAASE